MSPEGRVQPDGILDNASLSGSRPMPNSLLDTARQADHDEVRTVQITGGMLWDIADEIESLEALNQNPNTLYALIVRWLAERAKDRLARSSADGSEG